MYWRYRFSNFNFIKSAFFSTYLIRIAAESLPPEDK